MRRNLLAALAPVLLGAALFAAAPTLAPTALAQDATPEVADAPAALHPVVERTRSLRNLKQLGLATHSFADSEFQKSGITPFPARYSVDANGKPLHSWRVFLLPFIEQEELYKQIRLDEPWDSEHNRQFHSKTPELFRRPGSSDPGCVYVCVADESAVLQPTKKAGSQLGLAFPATTDGVSNTILFVERKKPVCWMDPNADLTLDEFLAEAADGSFGLPVLFADGRAVLLPNSLDPSLLKAYVTRAGGEAVPRPSAALETAEGKAALRDAFLQELKNAQNRDSQNPRSLDNLKQLALATHNFLDLNATSGEFTAPLLPARYSVDADGKPLHSWRVFLLPYLGQKELYDKIRLDEPWDSAHNRQFHDQTPAIYCRPGAPESGCVYSCVVDKTALLQPAAEAGSVTGIKLTDVVDGTSNTILFVERSEPVCWMDPTADLTSKELLAETLAVKGALPLVLLDGRAQLFKTLPAASGLDANVFKAYVTRAGGETFPQ